MRIIIVGVARGSALLAKMLAENSHDVIVVDKSQKVIDEITDKISVNGVCGSAASRDVLLAAGADTADVLISMVPEDETNLLACAMAKNIGTRRVIAKLERDELIGEMKYLCEKFSIDHILTPKSLISGSITKQIYYNAVNKVEQLFDFPVLAAELAVENDSPLVNKKLNEIKQSMGLDFMVFAVNRAGKMLVPKGNFELHRGDVIGIAAKNEEMLKLLTQIGLMRKPVKNVTIVGGGAVGESLAKQLLSNSINVKIIEQDRERCAFLMEELKGAQIIFGSGVDIQLMEEEKLRKADACVCLTGKDETNLLVSLIAWSNGVDSIITKIDTDSYERVLRRVTISVTVSSDRIIAANLMEYVQSLQSFGRFGAGESRYYQIGEAMAQICRFEIPQGFRRVGLPLYHEDMRLKKGIIIAAVLREGSYFVPKGQDSLKVGDSIVIISEKDNKILSLPEIFD